MGEVTLGGRVFHTADLERRTVRQDHFLESAIRASGLDKRIPEPSEGTDAYLLGFRAALVDSGQACRLLSAFLLPAGKTEADWTREMAESTQAHLEGLQTENDRQAINGLCMECALGFLLRALQSFATSQKSSAMNGALALSAARAAH